MKSRFCTGIIFMGLSGLLLSGCVAGTTAVQPATVVPYGTEINAKGQAVMPYGTEINAKRQAVMPYGTQINDPEQAIRPYESDMSAVAEPQPNTTQSDTATESTVQQPDTTQPGDSTTQQTGTDTDSEGTTPYADEAELICTLAEAGSIPSDVAAELGYYCVTHELPAVFIYTEDGNHITSRDEYSSCTIYTVHDPSGTDITGQSAGVRIRGNSTAYYGNRSDVISKQVPYRIRFDVKTSMMGLNDGLKRRSWVLLKCDWSGINDELMFRLGRTILHDYLYCSDAQLVYGYVNGEFKGLYVLCEQNQTGKGRVEINEPDEGYTGTDIGYFIELDNYCEAPYVRVDYAGATVTDINGTARKFTKAEYAIKSDIYSDEQTDFIGKYLNNVFYILYEACEEGRYFVQDEGCTLTELTADEAEMRMSSDASSGMTETGNETNSAASSGTTENGNEMNSAASSGTTTDRDSAASVCEYICSLALDLDAAADMYLVHEIGCSCDCGEGSFYMCVDFSGESSFNRLTFTAPWDFNWGFSCSTDEYWAAVFRDDSFVASSGDRSNPWFILLMKQEWFRERVSVRWNEVRSAAYDCLAEEEALVDAYAADIEKHAKNTSVYGMYSRIDWIEKRLRWFDTEFSNRAD